MDAILETEIDMISQDLKHQKVVEDTNRRPYNNGRILDNLPVLYPLSLGVINLSECNAPSVVDSE